MACVNGALTWPPWPLRPNHRCYLGPQVAHGESLVTWKVPADFADKEADVIISIKDRSEQEVFPTFKLKIAP